MKLGCMQWAIIAKMGYWWGTVSDNRVISQTGFYFVNVGMETENCTHPFVDMFIVLFCIVCNPILDLIQGNPSANQVFLHWRKIMHILKWTCYTVAMIMPKGPDSLSHNNYYMIGK